MKKIKLLLAAMAAMVGMGVQAQSWTASEVGAGNYVIYNVGSGQFLTAGNAWGTQASITTAGVSAATQVELIANGSNFFIRTGVGNSNYGLENLAAAGDVYMDQSRNKQATWTFTQVGTDNGPVYNIISADNHGGGSGAYLTANSGNTVVSDNGVGTSVYAQWKLLDAAKVPLLAVLDDYQAVRATVVAWTTSEAITNADEAKANFNTALAAADSKADAATTIDGVNEAIADLKAAGNTFLENVTIAGGLDITNVWITNPAPGISGNTNGWTNSGSPSLQNQLFEYWQVSAGTTKQTLSNLPKGAYKLTAIAYTRDNMTATLYAGENTVKLVGCGSVNTRGEGDTWIAANPNNGRTNLEFTLDAATASLEIGLIADNAVGDHWMCWRSFTLTYYGDPINLKKAELAEAVANATALEGTIPGGVYANVANVVAEKNQTYSTAAEYDAATAAIVEATNNAKVLQAPYSRYNTIKAAAKAVATDLNTTDADNAVSAATTAEAIETAIASLRAAFLAELPNLTVPTDGIDITAVMVENASVSQNTNYWTIANLSAEGGSAGVCNYGECEFYQRNFKFYQTLALTPGTWEFGVTGFHRAGNHNTHFYAGDDKILIPGVESSVVNNMADAKTYFDNGNGKVALKFLVEAAGDIEIGIDNQDTETDKWTIFRNFTLKYFGAPDYSIYVNQWNALVTDAATAKDANATVTGSELTALNAALADEPDGSNKANYLEKIGALETALATFNAAAPAYKEFADAKAETVALWGNTLGVADPATAAEAAAGIQALNIAQYNKVASEYTFSATGLIGDFGSWEGTATVAGEAATPNYLDYEHWSGVTHAYYEQASNGWGNAQGWTIKYEKKCTLPAGDYVIKVAARSSAGTTSLVSCSATTNTVTLPNVGASARGINKAGEASWNDGEFVNSGNGFGWQWRFLPFSLSAETEVTMTFYAEATTQYQWMSIADGELLSTTKLAQDVAFNEDNDNTIENTIIADVTMTRTIKEGYNTVVVPFTLTANQVAAAFGTGTEVYAFSENGEENAEYITINFSKGDGSISANVPVLVKATAASSSQVFEGVQVVAPAEGAIVEGTNANFVGVFGPTTIGEGHFFVGNGAIYKSAGSTNIKAFRAYILLANPNTTPEVKMFIDGVATRISDINGMGAENGTIYNIAGQRVNNAQKGIFIVNGKKVVK